MVFDIGCGNNKCEPGSIGLDRSLNSKADVVCDLNRSPWPLRDNVASKLYLSHILEHLEDVMGAMAEVHRIGQPGARVLVVTPHFSSHDSYTDPTHRYHLAWGSFDHFSGEPFQRFAGPSFRFRILERRLSFGGNLVLDGLGRLIAAISTRWYERHVAWIFPAREIFCTLEVIKG
jgi:hypothetical protein